VTASTLADSLQIDSVPPDHILGTFDATIGGQSVSGGTFETVLDSELDFITGTYSGTFDISLSGTVLGSPFLENVQASFTELNVVSSDFADPNQNSVSGQVFFDEDGDGILDPTEGGLSGLTAELLDDGTVVDSVAVDPNGYYSFFNLGDGAYQVRFDGLAADQEFSPLLVGDDPAVDSDIDPTLNESAIIDFTTENTLLDFNAGIRTIASVGAAVDTVGLYQPDISLFHLNDSNSSSGSVEYTNFGPDGDAGWIAIHGDWDGDGTDTIGLYQPSNSLFHLKNSLSGAAADVYTVFGPDGDAGWLPLAGDWDGDGTDTIGLYQPDLSLFHLKDTLDNTGVADTYARFGPDGDAGWIPLVGDWNGDGTDTIGLYQPSDSLFHLKNIFGGGSADVYVAFGAPGSSWMPVTGDWDGDGNDTIGLYDPIDSEFHLKDSLSPGDADHLFRFGPDGDAGWMPLTGDWGGPETTMASSSVEGQSTLVTLADDQVRLAAKLSSQNTTPSAQDDDEQDESLELAFSQF